MGLPTVAEVLQVSSPVFVRKLRRRSDWGASSDHLAQRVKDSVEKLFRSQAEPTISVFLINTDEDLRRVALGLNAGRASLKEAVAFVAFLPSELHAAAINVTQTPGDLPCTHGNSLHYDILATDQQLAQLCELAMKTGRTSGNCATGMMKEVITEATRENCRTVATEGDCNVKSCQPL